MKWFKHDAQSLHKANIEKLIMEFGIEGYGLYYACVEIIAGNLSTENITFELEHDAKVMAYKFRMDTLKVEEIMHRCIEYDLFDLADSGHIRCLSLAKMLDESTSRHPEFSKLQKKVKNSGLIPEKLPNRSGQNRKISEQKRIEQNRIEEKRREKNNTFKAPNRREVVDYAKSKNMIVDVDMFFDYYDENDWFDKYGNKVKNWKLKLQTWNKKEQDKKSEKEDELSKYYI